MRELSKGEKQIRKALVHGKPRARAAHRKVKNGRARRRKKSG